MIRTERMNANSQPAHSKAAVITVSKCARALTCLLNRFYLECSKLIYSSMADKQWLNQRSKQPTPVVSLPLYCTS